MHRLLARQLRRHLGSAEAIPAEWEALLAAVSDAYEQADADRALLDRAMNLASEELFEANRRLRSEVEAKEGLLREATEARRLAETRAAELAAKSEELQRQTTSLEEARGELEDANERLRRHSEQLRGLAAAAVAIHSLSSMEESLRVITEQARHVIGAHQAVTSMSIDQDLAQAINAVSLSDRYAAWRDYDTPPDGSGIYRLVAQTNRPMRMTQEELEAHPAWRGFGAHAAEHPPMRGWLAVPLVGRDGGNMGLIQLSDRYEGEFTEEDEAVLVQFAQMAAITIENAQLFQDLQEANAAKADFLATMSHELRTPLNAMIGYTDLLQLGVPEPIGEGAQAQVARVGLAARHLLQLIEEILTFSRLEADRETLDAEPVDLGELVHEVHAIVQPLAEEKGLRFDVCRPASLDVVETDPRKLRQILINLLGNAVKFTSQGEVELAVGHEDGWTLFRVRDTGIGIPPEHLETIFEPFRQLETDRAKRAHGTGLGLSVSRRLARLLGGDLTVTSQVGVGSTFTLSLPRSGG